MGAFAVAAFFLAGIGTHGLLSFGVAQRSAEIDCVERWEPKRAGWHRWYSARERLREPVADRCYGAYLPSTGLRSHLHDDDLLRDSGSNATRPASGAIC